MDDDPEDHSSSIYNTPYQDSAQSNSSAARWNYPPEGSSSLPASSFPPGSSSSPRLRPSRHSSLQHLQAHRGSPASIFGSAPSPGPAMEEQQDQQQDSGAERPTFAVTHPSQEHVPISQPPLSTLTAEVKRSGSWYDESDRSLVDRRRLPQVEKDADDPTAAPSSSRSGIPRRESTTLTTLTRLFAVQAPLGSPEASRSSSYIQVPKQQTTYARNMLAETAALPDHLYNRGLMEGRHSDITVRAFGHEYRLHRIILDRAPYFRSALSEPWLESNAKETTVRPEDIDASITQASFELALKRLYGCANVNEEDRDAVGLFATGCWLEMQDLIESSIESMLRQMAPENLSPLIKLVTSNYYGRAGDKLLASAKAMLCRDGWRMPLQFWDGIPGDIIREIVGGDGFFIDGEWERWVLAKRLMDRRLRLRAIDAGLVEPGTTRKVLKAPDTTNLMAVRFDAVYRRNGMGSGRGIPDRLYRWTSMYTHPDVEPILVLLDEGIHYVHMDFEQLQLIKDSIDVFGLPVLSQKVIGDALWQQMELRQKILNAREGEMELGVSVCCPEDAVVGSTAKDTTMSIMKPAAFPPAASDKGKHRAEDVEEVDEGMESGSWDGNGQPRKFWIPSSDCNIVMGGNADPIIATSNNTTIQRHASRLSATLQPEDVQWMSDFSAVTSQPRILPHHSPDGAAAGEGSANSAGDVRYSHFPPFRFAAEFPNPRLLKAKKRVYSRTVFYAGSLWNIYIQKVESSRSKQLGVYLHRAKERETEEVIAGTAGLAQGTVDERIGMLEREMLMRSERRERRQRRRGLGSDGFPLANDPNDSEGSAGDQDTLVGIGSGGDVSSSSARPSLMRDLLARSHQRRPHLQPEPTHSDSTSTNPGEAAAAGGEGGTHTPPTSSPSDYSDSDSETERLLSASKNFRIPTIPPYVDARPTIKTYFKIYSPSRGGRMLSVYESAPDRFNFSQSWGWKSSTLMLDEGLLGEDGQNDEEGGSGDGGVGSGGGGSTGMGGGGRGLKGRGDGKLRFMVVIGNI